MTNKKQEKDFIIGDVHGQIGELKKVLKDIGFEVSQTPVINVGSPPEQIPQGEIPDLSNFLEKAKDNIKKMQNANTVHHDAQYKKMYPSKKK